MELNGTTWKSTREKECDKIYNINPDPTFLKQRNTGNEQRVQLMGRTVPGLLGLRSEKKTLKENLQTEYNRKENTDNG